MIEYHQYTVRDVREWLYDGIKNGLSEQIIAKSRADSIIHCPCVTDDSVVIVSATDGNKIVGYTAMFPEHWVKPDIWTSNATTLYADPEYAGEFIGYYVTKMLQEAAPNRYLIGTDTAQESVLIDKLLGSKADMLLRKRYVLNRKIAIHKLRNVFSLLLEPIRKCRQCATIRRELRKIPQGVEVEYINFIDNETYLFMLHHSENDMFLRSQEMLNWVLHYPFRIEAPQSRRKSSRCQFSSQSTLIRPFLAKVFIQNILVGVYMVVQRNDCINILLLYTENNSAQVVYRIILERVIEMHPNFLRSQYTKFNEYMEQNNIALKCYEEKFSFTRPKDMPIDIKKQQQGADGDMFA